MKNSQRVYKPGSVFCPFRTGDGHSSKPCICIQSLATYPKDEGKKTPPYNPKVIHAFPMRFCFRRGFPCLRLLPAQRCALTAPFHPYLFGKPNKRFVFCGTFRGLAPPGCYPAPCFYEARTFLWSLLTGGHPTLWQRQDTRLSDSVQTGVRSFRK